MKVILLQDVHKVGRKYEIKNVARGYARNFLIPNHLADIATENSIKNAEKMREKITALYADKVKQLESYLNKLSKVTLVIKGKVNKKGHLFAKIHAKEITDVLLKQADMVIDPVFIVLEAPIADVGEYDIKIKVNDKEGYFKLLVEAEE